MNIFPLQDAPVERSPQRTRYNFSFPDYELHLNELQSGAATDWHYHEEVWETVVVTDGALTIRWREHGRVNERVITSGDVVELGHVPQSLRNHTGQVAKFLAIKQVPSGEDRRELLQRDKVAGD